jgi:hypothetical protein
MKGHIMDILRKITLKAVCGKLDFEKLLSAPDKKLSLMRVYGIARKAKPDQSDLGAFIRFSGSFRAENMETGEVFQSGVLILPGVAQDLLNGALDGEGVEDVQFGFEIGAHYDADSVTKYVYDVKSLVAPAQDDPLERMSKLLGVKSAAAVEHKKGDNIKAEAEAEHETVKSGKKK